MIRTSDAWSLESVTWAGEISDLRGGVNLVQLSPGHGPNVLRKTGGNKTEAAAVLGLNRTTLVGKLKKLGVANRAGRG